MTTGQQQMLHNGGGGREYSGLRGFLCLPQMVPHSSHVIFNFSQSYFHVQGRPIKASGLISVGGFSTLGLKLASSVLFAEW